MTDEKTATDKKLEEVREKAAGELVERISDLMFEGVMEFNEEDIEELMEEFVQIYIPELMDDREIDGAYPAYMNFQADVFVLAWLRLAERLSEEARKSLIRPAAPTFWKFRVVQ